MTSVSETPKAAENVPTGAVGTVALAAGGLAAALGAASCCALPVVLGALGVGGIGFGGLALLFGPYQQILLTAAALCLGAGGALLWQRRVAQARGAVCARPVADRLALIGFLLAAVLVGLSLVYV